MLSLVVDSKTEELMFIITNSMQYGDNTCLRQKTSTQRYRLCLAGNNDAHLSFQSLTRVFRLQLVSSAVSECLYGKQEDCGYCLNN